MDRKQVLSVSADKTTMRLLTMIAARETSTCNRSETFRNLVHEAAVKRGLVPESQTKHEK